MQIPELWHTQYALLVRFQFGTGEPLLQLFGWGVWVELVLGTFRPVFVVTSEWPPWAADTRFGLGIKWDWWDTKRVWLETKGYVHCPMPPRAPSPPPSPDSSLTRFLGRWSYTTADLTHGFLFNIIPRKCRQTVVLLVFVSVDLFKEDHNDSRDTTREHQHKQCQERQHEG